MCSDRSFFLIMPQIVLKGHCVVANIQFVSCPSRLSTVSTSGQPNSSSIHTWRFEEVEDVHCRNLYLQYIFNDLKCFSTKRQRLNAFSLKLQRQQGHSPFLSKHCLMQLKQNKCPFLHCRGSCKRCKQTAHCSSFAKSWSTIRSSKGTSLSRFRDERNLEASAADFASTPEPDEPKKLWDPTETGVIRPELVVVMVEKLRWGTFETRVLGELLEEMCVAEGQIFEALREKLVGSRLKQRRWNS